MQTTPRGSFPYYMVLSQASLNSPFRSPRGRVERRDRFETCPSGTGGEPALFQNYPHKTELNSKNDTPVGQWRFGSVKIDTGGEEEKKKTLRLFYLQDRDPGVEGPQSECFFRSWVACLSFTTWYVPQRHNILTETPAYRF